MKEIESNCVEMAAHVVRTGRNCLFQFSFYIISYISQGQFGFIISHCLLKKNCRLKWLCLFGVWESWRAEKPWRFLIQVWPCQLHMHVAHEKLWGSVSASGWGKLGVWSNKRKGDLWYIHPRFWSSGQTIKNVTIRNPK